MRKAHANPILVRTIDGRFHDHPVFFPSKTTAGSERAPGPDTKRKRTPGHRALCRDLCAPALSRFLFADPSSDPCATYTVPHCKPRSACYLSGSKPLAQIRDSSHPVRGLSCDGAIRSAAPSSDPRATHPARTVPFFQEEPHANLAVWGKRRAPFLSQKQRSSLISCGG